MKKKSISKADFVKKVSFLVEEKHLPKKYEKILLQFFSSYSSSVEKAGIALEIYLPIFDSFLFLIEKLLQSPHTFSTYHKKIRSPFDYYQFGIDFLKPLIDPSLCRVIGNKYLDKIKDQIKAKKNIIFFSNHQTECDPQAISILLEEKHPHLAEKIIYVAGERVISDPLAIPFSLGCDLLCIYSKKYIAHPPGKKEEKLLHNRKTMQLMSQLLTKGGQIIYVAPSGGRDRPNKQGILEIAHFDIQSLEMFYLMAKKAKKTTHFYPLSLATYNILPPPDKTNIEMGEQRIAERGGIRLAVGEEIDMEHFPGSEEKNKTLKRKKRAEFIYSLVKTGYEKLV